MSGNGRASMIQISRRDRNERCRGRVQCRMHEREHAEEPRVSSALPPPGESASGSRYRILCPLGRGGMAEVHLALQTSGTGIERLAVIKRPRREFAWLPEFAAMFAEEARIAATLGHQNVVQTYEVGQDEAGSFLVLEFLRGQPLDAVARRSEYADYRVFIEVLLGTLQGLESAHALTDLSGSPMALVHRDVSPPNVFVTYDGQVKVLDFGIAKALGSAIRTHKGIIKGKLEYIAPEQMLGGKLDSRADLYAVGVMLWEATAGRRRFGGLSESAVMKALSSREPCETPGAVSRGLPALADEICRKALAFEPEHRYQSAAEFHDALLVLAALCGGRLPARLVGQYVADLFARERIELDERIETALERPTLVMGGVRPAAPRSAEDLRKTRALDKHESPSARPAQPARSVAREPLTTAGLQRDTERAAPNASRRSRARRWLAAAIVVAVCAAAFVFRASSWRIKNDVKPIDSSAAQPLWSIPERAHPAPIAHGAAPSGSPSPQVPRSSPAPVSSSAPVPAPASSNPAAQVKPPHLAPQNKARAAKANEYPFGSSRK